MKTKTLAHAVWLKNEQAARNRLKVKEELEEILSQGKKPKIFDIIGKLSDKFSEEMVDTIISVFVNTVDSDNINDLIKKCSHSISLRYKEIPLFLVQALKEDLTEKPWLLNNPNKQDLINSKFVKEATIVVKLYDLVTGINSLDINDYPLEHETTEFIKEPSIIEVIFNMHTGVVMDYLNIEAVNKDMSSCKRFYFYETLSEMLKTYPDKQSWDNDTLEQRLKKVPELNIWDESDLKLLEDHFIKYL